VLDAYAEAKASHAMHISEFVLELFQNDPYPRIVAGVEAFEIARP
jgi:hypothetical protein